MSVMPEETITLPAADTGSAGPGPTVIAGPSQLVFDTNGHMTTPAANVTGIKVTGLADGASDLDLTWNLYDNSGSPTITQMSAASTTASTNQDGYNSGTVKDFSVDASGILQGTFTNGQVMALGQIAIASFANQQGLQRNGSNFYTPTLSSGAATIGTPGTGGRGVIAGGSLELSNVDVAKEFAKMILAQRGYEANAKVVTTFDTVSQDTIALIR